MDDGRDCEHCGVTGPQLAGAVGGLGRLSQGLWSALEALSVVLRNKEGPG